MTSSAIYFPYMRVRDGAWLRGAALFWDRLYSFRPRGYRLNDSPDTRDFTHAGFLRPICPESYTTEVAADLLAFVRDNIDTLRDRYNAVNAMQSAKPEAIDHGYGPPEGYPGLGWLHVDKINRSFAEFMIESDLAVRARDQDPHWLGFHPDVAAAYMVALADTCARANQLAPATDQLDPRLAPSTSIAAAMRLLGNERPSDGPADNPSRWAMLAIESVMPRDLILIPAERILQIREALSEELANFREFVASQQAELEQLATIRDDGIQAQAYADHVKQAVIQPLERLDRGLRSSGFETVRSLVSIQTVSPPLIASAAVHYAGAPPFMTAAAGIALAMGNAWWQYKADRERQIAASKVGYLLSVRDALLPHTAASRMARFLRGT